MEQPSKHQLVLTEARRQLCLQRQLRVRGEVAAVLMTAVSLHLLSEANTSAGLPPGRRGSLEGQGIRKQGNAEHVVDDS